MKVYGMELVLDDKGRVKGAVVEGVGQLGESMFKYAYEPCKDGGWDNCSGDYTPEQARRKIYRGTMRFM